MVLSTTGPRRLAHTAHKNVGKSERAVSATIGGLLVASAIKKRGVGGLALALVGAELMRRGATGHCMLYDAIGFSSVDREGDDFRSAAATVNARRAIKVEQWITIGRPAHELYQFWRDFTNLPRILDDIESVTDAGDGRSHWVAVAGGARIQWDAEMVNDVPGELIAWKTVGHPDVAHAGSVHFKQTPSGRETIVRLVMDYEPPGGRLSAVAAKLIGESPDQKIRADLVRLKELLE